MVESLQETKMKNRSSPSTMVNLKKNQHCYQNLLANRGIPILFIVICSLIVANTRCDKVGSANGSVSTLAPVESITTTSSLTSSSLLEAPLTQAQLDPLSKISREIYLDENSIIKIMPLTASIGDPVQKFHPNGRYGRRSVDNMVEPASAHSELGRLRTDNNNGPLRSILNHLNQLKENPNNNNADRSTNEPINNQLLVMDPIERMSLEQELNKLLKCNYTGVSNLYWCYTGI